MNVLVIGAGGRTCISIHQSPLIEKLYAIPEMMQ